jgi:tetratricopeptide (TPR) repeat protein
MIALATDSARHARMLDMTGGDAGALAEIRQIQDFLLTEADPDLFALARLSIHRNDIEDRNDRLPSALPALWAALGQPARAEALARSLPSPHRRVMALTEVATALDDHERAVQVIAEAEQVAGFGSDPRERFDALVEAAIRAAEADSHEYSLRLITTAADLITSSAKVSEWSLRRFVEAATESGAFDLAEQVARSGRRVDLLALIAPSLDAGSSLQMIAEVEGRTPDPLSRLCLVKAAAAVGDLARVDRIITNAERAARESNDPVVTLSRVAAVTAAAGDRRRALSLVAEAESSAHSSSGSDNLREDSLMELVKAAAAAGDLDRAERTARRITESRLQGVAWTTVVDALAVAGDYDRAEEIAHEIDASEWHDAAFSVIAQALVAAGEPERARRVAAHAACRPTESGCLIDIARAAVAAGDHPRAELLVTEAEHMARETIDPHELAERKAEVANALAMVGELARAERLARAIVEPVRRVRALIDVAQTVMTKGDREQATRIATAAVRMLPRLDDSSQPVDVTVDAARAIALTGDFETAAEVAHGIVEPQDRLLGLSEVAMAAAEARNLFHAGLLVAHAEELARDIGSNDLLVHNLTSLTTVMNRIGAVDRAARLTRDLEHPKLFVRRKLADPGPRDLAEVFATESWLEALPVLAWLQPDLVARIAAEAFPES